MSIYALSNDLKKNELHRAYLEQKLSKLSDSEKEKILEIKQSLEEIRQLIKNIAYELHRELTEQSKKREALYNIAIKFNDSETAKRCSDEIAQYNEQLTAIEHDYNNGAAINWLKVIEKQDSEKKSVFAQMAWFISQRDHLISLFNHAKKSGDVDLQQSLRTEYAEILEQQHNFTQGLGFFKATLADFYKLYLVLKPRKNVSPSSEEKQKQRKTAKIFETVILAAVNGLFIKLCFNGLVSFFHTLAKAVKTLPALGSIAAIPTAALSVIMGAAATAVASGVVGVRLTANKENRTFRKYLTSALKGTSTGLIAGTTVLGITSLFGPVPFGFIAAIGAGSYFGAAMRLQYLLSASLDDKELDGKEYFKNNRRSELRIGSILGAFGGLGGALFQHIFFPDFYCLNNAIATPAETPELSTAPKTLVPAETLELSTAPKTLAPAETPELSTAPKTLAPAETPEPSTAPETPVPAKTPKQNLLPFLKLG